MGRSTPFERELGRVKERVLKAYGWSQDLQKSIERLKEVHRGGRTNVNHAAIALVLAAYLENNGYQVQVEKEVNQLQVDVWGYRGETVVAEVETGYVPPWEVHRSLEYLTGRLSTKIARYSTLGEKFLLAVPPFYLPPIPRVFIKNPERRDEEDLKEEAYYIGLYANVDGVGMDSLRRAKVDNIALVDVGEARVKLLNPDILEKWIHNL